MIILRNKTFSDNIFPTGSVITPKERLQIGAIGGGIGGFIGGNLASKDLVKGPLIGAGIGAASGTAIAAYKNWKHRNDVIEKPEDVTDEELARRLRNHYDSEYKNYIEPYTYILPNEYTKLAKGHKNLSSDLIKEYRTTGNNSLYSVPTISRSIGEDAKEYNNEDNMGISLLNMVNPDDAIYYYPKYKKYGYDNIYLDGNKNYDSLKGALNSYQKTSRDLPKYYMNYINKTI